MKTAAIYARVSTDEQKYGYGAKVQIDACESLAQQSNFENLAFFTTDATDNGIQGTIVERPGIKELYKFLAQNRDCKDVFVYDSSRLGRDEATYFVILKELHKYDVTVHFAQDKTSVKPGQTTLADGLKGLMAADDYRRTIAKLAAARQRARSEGKPATRIDVFGYTKVVNGTGKKRTVKLVIDAAVSEGIYLILNSYLRGDKSASMIAKELNLRGIKYKGRNYTQMVVCRILQKSYTYSGHWYQGVTVKNENGKGVRIPQSEIKSKVISGEVVPFTDIEPYITFQEADKIFELLSGAKKNSGRLPKNSVLLRGFCYCGECGSRAHIDTTKRLNGSIVHYITCGFKTKKKHNSNLEGDCNGFGAINTKLVDDLIYSSVISQFSKENLLSLIDSKRDSKGVKEIQKEIDGFERQLKQLESKLEEIENGFRDGDISIKQLGKFTKENEERQHAVTEKIEMLRHQLQDVSTTHLETLLTNVDEIKARLSAATSVEDRRALLETLRVRVVFQPGQHVTLYLTDVELLQATAVRT